MYTNEGKKSVTNIKGAVRFDEAEKAKSGKTNIKFIKQAGARVFSSNDNNENSTFKVTN